MKTTSNAELKLKYDKVGGTNFSSSHLIIFSERSPLEAPRSHLTEMIPSYWVTSVAGVLFGLSGTRARTWLPSQKVQRMGLLLLISLRKHLESLWNFTDSRCQWSVLSMMWSMPLLCSSGLTFAAGPTTSQLSISHPSKMVLQGPFARWLAIHQLDWPLELAMGRSSRLPDVSYRH